MIEAIKEMFYRCLSPEQDRQSSDKPLEQRLQLATAALLVEMMHADFEATEEERHSMIQALQKGYQLDQQELDQLIHLAEQEQQEATSLYGFTKLINDHYSEAQKLEIIRLLWQVAYADQHYDEHELHLMRKIADLLYIPREVAMGIRDQIRKSQQNTS